MADNEQGVPEFITLLRWIRDTAYTEIKETADGLKILTELVALYGSAEAVKEAMDRQIVFTHPLQKVNASGIWSDATTMTPDILFNCTAAVSTDDIDGFNSSVKVTFDSPMDNVNYVVQVLDVDSGTVVSGKQIRVKTVDSFHIVFEDVDAGAVIPDQTMVTVFGGMNL